MSSSLFYLTGGNISADYSIDNITLNGTSVSGSPTVVSSGQPAGGFYNAIAVDPAANLYFVGVYNGSSAAQIYRETFGATPSFGSGNEVANVSGDIAGSIGIDTANNILYYTDGQNLYADNFGSSFNNTPSQVTIGATPGAGTANPVYLQSLTYDQADHAIYAAGYSGSVYYPFTGPTVETINGNFIYKISVTPGMGTNSASFTSALSGGGQVPLTDGRVNAVALDTATDTLYFATTPIVTTPSEDVAGIYALNLSTGQISTVWNTTFSGTPSSGLTDITAITIDPLTGDYYLTDGSAGHSIYAGNINSHAAPVAVLTTQTGGQDSTTYPLALAVIDPASITGISVTKVNGTTASTGTVTTGGTVTFSITFTEAVSVTGTPALALNDGGSASYSAGSGSNTLVFTYTAQSGQNTSALAVTGVSTSSGSIQNSAGGSASLTTGTVTFNGLAVETTPPTITLSANTADALQGGASLAVLSGTPVITAANGTLNSATIVLSGYQSGDVLGINGATSGTYDSGKISFSESNGTLTLSGTDSLSAYESALGAVTYQDGGTDISSGAHPTRSLSWHVADSVLGGNGNATSITIDRAPSIAAGGASGTLLAGGSLSLGAGAALTGDSDIDGDSLTISAIAGGVVGSALSGTYGALTLSADGSYSYSASNSGAIASAPTGSAPVDDFTFTVSDGKGGSALETLAITIDRLPGFSTGAAVTYTPGGGAVALDATGIVSDPDGALLTGAAVYFTGTSLPGDTLSFTPQSGISGIFSGGTLVLSGTASAAAYQAALQSVQYNSTDADPYGNGADPSRTIAIVLTDAYGSGTAATTSIIIDPTIDIPAGSAVSLGTVSAGRDVVFLGAGTLGLTSPLDFAGSITSFGSGDTIALDGLNAAAESYALGTLTLFNGLGATLASLTLGEPGSITSADFHLASDGAGGTDITLCFYPGTRIATPGGEVAVEELQPGDIVLTEDGPAPLRWVGHSHISTRFADSLRSLPIRITQGALGEGLPRRDLLLSPDHALLIGKLLVQAGALVNGSTIRREHDVPEQFTYYHLELDRHALLLAEGALTESFVDNVERMHFHNWNSRAAPAARIRELPYPRAKSARQLPNRIRARLDGKAGAVA